jgi:hypothetical protein
MNPAYPGFHHFWRHKARRDPGPFEPAPLPWPLHSWPEERPSERVPEAPDPLDYGRVASGDG